MNFRTMIPSLWISIAVSVVICLLSYDERSVTVCSYTIIGSRSQSSSRRSTSSRVFPLRSTTTGTVTVKDRVSTVTTPTISSSDTDETKKRKEELLQEKKKLLSLLLSNNRQKIFNDPVLADPLTKEGVQISSNGGTSYQIKSPTSTYGGSAETWLDFLEPISDTTSDDNNDTSSSSSSSSSRLVKDVMKQAVIFIPPQLRGPISLLMSTVTGEKDSGNEYIPMRDLFTSPSVSFAYERGWRQGFAAAGFPGADTEAQMAIDYFANPVAMGGGEKSSVVVDMSCATGLFTRRLVASGKYGRVLGCDYSSSMLTEARRRITAEKKKNKFTSSTTFDLIRLDVGQIPMQTDSVDCVHAGAALHCWPDLDAAVSEIYRVLKPGGRHFATTFLSTYFKNTANLVGGSTDITTQAFQYFETTEVLRDLYIRGGFQEEKILIEVLGTSCVVIRAEK